MRLPRTGMGRWPRGALAYCFSAVVLDALATGPADATADASATSTTLLRGTLAVSSSSSAREDHANHTCLRRGEARARAGGGARGGGVRGKCALVSAALTQLGRGVEHNKVNRPPLVTQVAQADDLRLEVPQHHARAGDGHGVNVSRVPEAEVDRHGAKWPAQTAPDTTCAAGRGV